jgi:hypothetical protein
MDEKKFKKSRRFVLVKECITKGKEIGTDMSTLFFCLASLTDKGLTNFHKEFIKSK